MATKEKFPVTAVDVNINPLLGVAGTPTHSQVPVYSTATGYASWGTVSGGSGTTLYDHWDPLSPDSPTQGYEFDTTDLSAFTVVNSRGTIDADTTATNKLYMSLTDQQYRYVCYLRALPGDTNYTIHTRVWVAATPVAGLAAVAGIVISDTNTTNSGKQTGVIFGNVGAVANTRCTSTWDGFGETAAGAALPSDAVGGHSCDIRFRKESGTYYAAWSGDGETWYEETIGIYGSITPAYFGVYAQNYSGSVARFSFEFLRYYSNGTQYRTGSAENVLG